MIAPPFTALEAVAAAIAGTDIRLAAQNVHWEPKGAFTGEISAAMLREAGCTHVIIGHSERRQYFGETDETVHERLGAALAASLTPIVCVGETLAEREGGATAAVIERQVEAAFRGLAAEALARCIVAYEPVWAIGTGRTATPGPGPGGPRRHPRPARRPRRPESWRDGVRILYGGSVKPDNVDALMAEPDIDGALVGGASLEVGGFTRIVQFQELTRHDPSARSPTSCPRSTCSRASSSSSSCCCRPARAPTWAPSSAAAARRSSASGGAGNFLTRLTTGTAIAFMVTSLILTYGQSRSNTSRLIEKLPAATAPAVPSAPAADAPAAAPDAAPVESAPAEVPHADAARTAGAIARQHSIPLLHPSAPDPLRGWRNWQTR